MGQFLCNSLFLQAFYEGRDRGVVYTTAADNSRSPRIRYNALISPLSVGALPWYHPSFSTNSASSLWCGSSSCSAGWDRTPPSGASRSRHRRLVLRHEIFTQFYQKSVRTNGGEGRASLLLRAVVWLFRHGTFH